MAINYNFERIRINRRVALAELIDRNQQTIARLKNMGHRTVDAERHLGDLIEELAVFDMRNKLVSGNTAIMLETSLRPRVASRD